MLEGSTCFTFNVKYVVCAWRLSAQVPIGGAKAPAEVDTPYVATAGPPLAAEATPVRAGPGLMALAPSLLTQRLVLSRT